MATTPIESCRLYYEKHGSGTPTLLFVHGGFCDHRDWRFQVDDLRDDFTVVTIDQRCQGASTAPYESCSVGQFAMDVHEVIDALKLGPTIVVGHSLGARVTIQAAADRPDHLLGAVFVDGSRLTRGDSDEAVKKVEDARFGDNPADYLAYRFRAMFFENADPQIRNHVIATAASTPRAAIEAIARATAHWDALGLEPALRKIPSTLPALAIQSTYQDDKTERYPLKPGTTTTPWLDLLRNHLPQLEIVITPGVGHFNMLESPEAVSAAIREFALRLRP